jgi:hypothetical protein
LRQPVLGALVAVWISWAIGIVVLPIAATLLGVTLREGVGCIDLYAACMRDGDLTSGFVAYVSTLIRGGIFVLPWLIGGLLVGAAAIAGSRHALIAGVVLAVVAHGAVHFWSLLLGGLAAWLCLAVGVVIWSAVLPRPAFWPATPRPAAPAIEAPAEALVPAGPVVADFGRWKTAGSTRREVRVGSEPVLGLRRSDLLLVAAGRAVVFDLAGLVVGASNGLLRISDGRQTRVDLSPAAGQDLTATVSTIQDAQGAPRQG